MEWNMFCKNNFKPLIFFWKVHVLLSKCQVCQAFYRPGRVKYKIQGFQGLLGSVEILFIKSLFNLSILRLTSGSVIYRQLLRSKNYKIPCKMMQWFIFLRKQNIFYIVFAVIKPLKVLVMLYIIFKCYFNCIT